LGIRKTVDSQASWAAASRARLQSLAFSLCVAVAACGGGGGGDSTSPPAPPPSPGVDGSPYFPLAVGDAWLEQSGFGSFLTDYQRTRVVRTSPTQFGTGYVVQSNRESVGRPGLAGREEIIVKSSDGVRVINPGDFVAATLGPIHKVKFPLRVGERHTAIDVNLTRDLDGDGRVDTVSSRIEVTVVGFESLSLESGNFTDVLHLRSQIASKTVLTGVGPFGFNQSVVGTLDEWFGRGIGRLRSVFTPQAGQDGSAPAVVLREWQVAGNRDVVAPTVTFQATRNQPPGDRPALVTMTFSKQMDPTSLGNPGIEVQAPNGELLNGFHRWTDNTLEFMFSGSSLRSGVYKLRFLQIPTDRLGNSLTGAASFSFELDTEGPKLLASTPANGASGVARDAKVILDFDEALDTSSPSPIVLIAFDGVRGGPEPVRVEISGKRVTITPLALLEPGKTYEVFFGGGGNVGLKDLAGNGASQTPLSFSTRP